MPNVINVSHIRLRIGSVITIPIHSNYIVEVCRVDWNPLTKSGTINVYLSPAVPHPPVVPLASCYERQRAICDEKPLAPLYAWTRTSTETLPSPAREERYEELQEPRDSPRLR